MNVKRLILLSIAFLVCFLVVPSAQESPAQTAPSEAGSKKPEEAKPPPDRVSTELVDLAARLAALEQRFGRVETQTGAADPNAAVRKSYNDAFKQAKDRSDSACRAVRGKLTIWVDNAGKVSVSCALK